MADVPGPFDSAWLKWAWAVKESEVLAAEIKTFAADAQTQALTTTALEYHPNRHCFILSVATLPPFPARFSLRLGNIVHNYRCCFDHIAWAIVDRGRTPTEGLSERAKRAISFPICRSRAAFTRSIKGKKRSLSRLPGARLADLAKVRASQPYIHGKWLIPFHHFTVLADFSNRDKHRTIQPAMYRPTQAALYVIDDATDCEITRSKMIPPLAPLQINTELARVYVRKTGPNPRLKMQVHAAVEPAISADMPLRAWLEDMPELVARLLSLFVAMPKEVKRLGPFVGGHGRPASPSKG